METWRRCLAACEWLSLWGGGPIPEKSVEVDGREVVLLAAAGGEDTEESACQEGGCQPLVHVKTTEGLILDCHICGWGWWLEVGMDVR